MNITYLATLDQGTAAGGAHQSAVAAGAGIINMSHEIYWIVAAVAGVGFLVIGLLRGLRDHHKRGTGSALSAIGGGILLAVVAAHVVGIYNRGNQEFDDLDRGGHGTHLPSGNRGW
ncbi:hypothetical protein [Mycobacterium attenuatum]|uniref:hypothetical protein n=1 Tax=Mycobacterium attenuatum TaxID=2341086 RepID=UPI000F042CC8|nr:hypothetical protein [Mycobacterium attenuatum]VBA62388.1 hypothetical protein LAUMK41_05779 [Mycobacterium attenuatum]